jgi:predicted Zn-dependent protease
VVFKKKSINWKRNYRRINLYDISVMEMTPADRALAVKEMFDIAANKNTELFGAYSVKDWVTAIASSTGFYGYHTETTADLTVTAMDDQKLAGWSEEHAHRIMEIDHRGAAKRAVEKVLLGKKKHTIQPGRYDVILEHAAVSSLLFWLVYLGMGGRSYAEGTSWLTGRLGEKLAGDNFTVTEDAMWPGTDGRTFDYQGFNRQAVTLFEKGVAKGLVHDMESASKAGCQSTGHGNPHPASYGPAPFNVRMDEGDSSIAEMIKNTERGIYVTHFHYENVVDPKVPIMTGMTRDGTFLVENGEIVGSIGNLRYNEKLLDVFSRMDSISSDRKLFFEYGKYQVPAVKVKDFQFTGASDGEAS